MRFLYWDDDKMSDKDSGMEVAILKTNGIKLKNKKMKKKGKKKSC